MKHVFNTSDFTLVSSYKNLTILSNAGVLVSFKYILGKMWKGSSFRGS